jgi:hypothetical protein
MRLLVKIVDQGIGLKQSPEKIEGYFVLSPKSLDVANSFTVLFEGEMDSRMEIRNQDMVIRTWSGVSVRDSSCNRFWMPSRDMRKSLGST